MELNVNISDDNFAQYYIDSLAWYHNGTQIVSGNKYTISNNDTMLMISNMVGSDAGTYEVKVHSISESSTCLALGSPLCDSTMLELHPVFTPVTFTVQESCAPSYDPSSIISIAYVSDYDNSVRLDETVRYSSPLSITHTRHYWYRNGILLSDGDMYNSTGSLQEGLSLQIMYNNTADVTGSYMGILLTQTRYVPSLCCDYGDYFDSLHSNVFVLMLSLWDVNGECTEVGGVCGNKEKGTNQ